MDPGVAIFGQVMLVIMASLAALVGISLGTRAMWRLGSRRSTENLSSSAALEELQRLQNAVDAIAIEVERISESQRFTVALLGNRLPPVDAKHNGDLAGGGSAARIESPR